MLVKVFYKDSCRRFTLDAPSAACFDSISDKIRSLFDIAPTSSLDLKCRDFEGDWVTVGTPDELALLLENDVSSDESLKIYVDAPTPASAGASTPTQTTARLAQDGITKHEVIGMLRDISLYISNNDPGTVKQWVSAERNLITPESQPQLLRPPSATDVQVAKWSVARVCAWAKAVGFGEMEKGFAENDISGKVLLALDSATLKELGLQSAGRRIRLLAHIAELKEE
ncbi:hypothetical protein BDZ88DRAFT_106179 [Geranomyces variabilis]|nr:hypothetical protein BDZ88DRAFT_106179 [Geranomyces variabilis]KAJ3141141.1 polar growth protein [Geranomyces variabilis]